MKSNRWVFYVCSLAIPAIPYLLMIYYPEAIDAVVRFFSTHRVALLAVPVYVHCWGLWVLHTKVPPRHRTLLLTGCGFASLCLLVLLSLYFNIPRWRIVTISPILYLFAAVVLGSKAKVMAPNNSPKRTAAERSR